MSHLLEYVLIDSSIYLLYEMRITCISLHPFQLRDEVIYSVWCYSYDTDHFLQTAYE